MYTWISSPVSCLSGDRRQHPVFFHLLLCMYVGGLVGVGVCICASGSHVSTCGGQRLHWYFSSSLSTFHFLRTRTSLTLDCPKGQWASEMYNKTLKTKIKDEKISHVPWLTELILQKKMAILPKLIYLSKLWWKQFKNSYGTMNIWKTTNSQR